MTTVLGKEGDNLYTAFYEPNAKKRKKALDKWVKKTAPSIQKAIAEELTSLVEFITQDRWTDEGWKRGEEKLRRIQPDYHLIMDIKLRSLSGRERKSYKGELPPSAFKKEEKTQNKHGQIGELPTSAFMKEEKPQGRQNRAEDEDDDYEDGGRSPNDDRSDSMNPNNDDYQASMDNRSDQMNPNNDAYWSSRGR
ncbi:hypothetical protein ACFLXO_04765 [Chloroflexota bacterium]